MENKLTNDEVNRYIAVEIMGLCWHELTLSKADIWTCSNCDMKQNNYGGMLGEPKDNPDYCSDLSPRALLNEAVAKVIETVGKGRFSLSLFKWTFGYDFNGHLFDGLITVVGATKFAEATAEQIARACVAAHRESQNAETGCETGVVE